MNNKNIEYSIFESEGNLHVKDEFYAQLLLLVNVYSKQDKPTLPQLT